MKISDFWLVVWISLVALPLIEAGWLLRVKKPQARPYTTIPVLLIALAIAGVTFSIGIWFASSIGSAAGAERFLLMSALACAIALHVGILFAFIFQKWLLKKAGLRDRVENSSRHTC